MKPTILQFFECDHLPDHLREISVPFKELAAQIANRFPENAERSVCLRKLLEAKDCAVRSVLVKD